MAASTWRSRPLWSRPSSRTAERHPLAGRHGLPGNIVMVYGPRDDEELAVVEDLVRASHRFASGSPSG